MLEDVKTTIPVGCKNCGTVLGESILGWDKGFPYKSIQPYLTTQINDWKITCPTCFNEVDISKADSTLGQLVLADCYELEQLI